MVTIQLKRKKQTFVLVVKPTSNAIIVQKELHQIIQAIGGLGGNEDDVESGENGDEDIDIPVPSFQTSDSDDDADDDENKMNDIKSNDNKTIPDLNNIILGEPRDKNDPYGSGFKEVKDVKKGLDLVDNSILAFKLSDEDEFDVTEPIDLEE
ncbi:hypothetical protein BN7_460 [Wickerhamomyces ciferrii]|uniref:Uncharacterized protein n=1 Tax=Wickerhamomyces ciferrii (strain ATCC 14091 / BCRC 22168 / CBS 111 / JCM 3599 / NBRC 0793 / NRRL Y-1031 F-60-10) TaxID=1206466 RepID=K0KDD9_WICCF|nr:uncharacterized protein BN7_460 [Wickerhamomyces ciferrii]CCH40926.1 hypothetical protein BN7_460 [Wickerhamomyces ciferrii]